MNIRFTTDNAAFDGGDDDQCNSTRNAEIARILREIADAIEECEEAGPVVDINGNTIGSWRV
jgi:hypothetical protein